MGGYTRRRGLPQALLLTFRITDERHAMLYEWGTIGGAKKWYVPGPDPVKDYWGGRPRRADVPADDLLRTKVRLISPPRTESPDRISGEKGVRAMMPPRCMGRSVPRLRRRGSALVVVLAMLAMLAVMATSFMMLMRLDTRITRNYVDDQRCELMAYGVINYFKAVLRDDLDRTWNKYENRDTGVGFYSRAYSEPVNPRRQIPGIVENAWGTPVSNDFWFSAPWNTWGQSGGDIYASTSTSYYGVTQQSFAWNDKYGVAYAFIGRYREAAGYECDAWIGMANDCWDQNGRIVAMNYVGGGALRDIDDDMDGVANPNYVYPSSGPNEFSRENSVMYDSYYDQVPFVMQAGPTGYQPSQKLTGESALPGGLWWRWGVKIGPTHSSYANLNVHGNLDGADSQWLDNMGGLSTVKARRAMDEATDTWDSGSNSHLGRIEWQGFPDMYDAVMYHPSSAKSRAALPPLQLLGLHEQSHAGERPRARPGARAQAHPLPLGRRRELGQRPSGRRGQPPRRLAARRGHLLQAPVPREPARRRPLLRGQRGHRARPRHLPPRDQRQLAARPRRPRRARSSGRIVTCGPPTRFCAGRSGPTEGPPVTPAARAATGATSTS